MIFAKITGSKPIFVVFPCICFDRGKKETNTSSPGWNFSLIIDDDEELLMPFTRHRNMGPSWTIGRSGVVMVSTTSAVLKTLSGCKETCERLLWNNPRPACCFATNFASRPARDGLSIYVSKNQHNYRIKEPFRNWRRGGRGERTHPCTLSLVIYTSSSSTCCSSSFSYCPGPSALT